MTWLSVFTKESKSPPFREAALHCLPFHLPKCLGIKLSVLPFDEKISDLFIFSVFA